MGPQGIPGVKGDTGATGPKGDTGATGAAGARALVKTAAEAAGANCATGGVKLEAGVDVNGNSTLDTAEVDAALTRYVCNGAQGPQGIPGAKGDTGATGAKGDTGAAGPKGDTGATGPKGDTGAMGAAGPTGSAGPQGPMGPQGSSGAVVLYGDGSAGTFTVNVGQTVDLSTAGGVSSLPAGFNTQFNNITISGNLIVPSGTHLRATGDVTVNGTGTITVLPGVEDTGNGEAPRGVARTAASIYSGGQALTGLQAAQVRLQVAGGGAGARLYAGDNANGGAGGGSLLIAAGGNVRIFAGAAINANGQNGTNPQTVGASILGTGGGAGGVVIVVAKGAITLAGTIRANGGNGADGFNGNGGTGEGGGGGGGGGIIHLLSSSAATITGITQVNSGNPGANAAASSGTSVTTAGGGGACGGDGGNGGGFIPGTATVVTATSGQAGQVLKTVAPGPENLLMR